MEKSIFLQTFGESPVLKVLDFLTINDDFDYNMTDIAQESGISYSTIKLFWKSLEQKQIVKMTRVIGKARMYKLNTSSQIVKNFNDLYWETTKSVVDKNIANEILKIT